MAKTDRARAGRQGPGRGGSPAPCLAILAFVLAFALALPAPATRLPVDMTQNVQNVFPDGKIRLDGSIQTHSGELYLPLIPATAQARRKGKAVIEEAYPSPESPQVFIYGNGWCFLKVVRKGLVTTVPSLSSLPEKVVKHLLSCRLPPDLIVPEHFVLPASLKAAAGELALQFVNDQSLAHPDFGRPVSVRKETADPDGYFFLTCLKTGKIAMIDARKLEKLLDFPTEGTPSSMAFASGRLYITDQAKNRVLVLDPEARRFLGQIDLPRGAAPKGIAVLPNAMLMYVAESGAADVVVIEVLSHKVLMRTKVPPGPGRMAVTPNGNFLVVLNVTSGQATIISTLNQRVLASVPTGAMPTAVTLSGDSLRAYVSNRQSGTVSVIDIARKQVVATIKTGAGPTGLALSADDSRLFVANARDNTIWVIDTRTHEKLGEVKLPLDIDFPSCLTRMPDGKRLIVSSELTDTVGVLNLASLEFEREANIGHSSHDIVFAPTQK